ncbi:MAG: hypothetical protein OJF51_000438 [Nitrospira sp.]|nr:MAG: hypothetical protein OJF51_000438 [Nitrospira sp.]
MSVSKATEILGVRRVTLSDLPNEKSSLTARNGVAYGEGVSPQHGYAAQATSLT